MKAWPLILLPLATPAAAELVPAPSREDPRVQTVRFVRDQIVRLQTSPGNDLTVMLAPGEHIADVKISNPAIYQVTLSDARDSFLLHTSLVLFQGGPSGNGTITIASERGIYQFTISSTPGAISPYVLRFTYNRSERKRGHRDPVSSYKLTGNKGLRPISIRDDGSKTYIQWSSEQPIPAVFALDRLGREEMVDGYMRAGIFTIDRIHDRLVFRIDNTKAEAKRPKERSQ